MYFLKNTPLNLVHKHLRSFFLGRGTDYTFVFDARPYVFFF
jgi:hypothetical protein